METEILTTIAAAAGAAKTTIDAVKSILAKTKGDHEAEKATREALALADDLLARLLQLKEVAFRLQEENAQLRADIRREEKRAADRDRYERRHIGSSPVMVRKDEPKTPLCATCFEDGKKVYLTKLSRTFADDGTHLCPKCKGIVGAP